MAVQDGWDSLVVVVNGEWIERFPRRPDIAARVPAEVRVLRLLASALPVAVPQPVAVCEQHGSMLYRRIDGEPLSERTLAELGPTTLAQQVADVLAGLRRLPEEAARRAGVPDISGQRWRDHYVDVCDRFRGRIVPLLPDAFSSAARRFLDELPDAVAIDREGSGLVHRDLGPSHLLRDAHGLAGIIDWSDCCIGDPAIDAAWLLHGAPRPLAERLRQLLPFDHKAMERALLYHRLGPWYEVEYGLDIAGDAAIHSGIEGVISRLSAGHR